MAGRLKKMHFHVIGIVTKILDSESSIFWMVATVELDAQQPDAAADEKGEIALKDANVWTVRTYIQSQMT